MLTGYVTHVGDCTVVMLVRCPYVFLCEPELGHRNYQPAKQLLPVSGTFVIQRERLYYKYLT